MFQSNIDNEILDEFEIRFNQVHSDFLEKLNKFASEPLTQKEVEVLLCIAEGKNNKQAADSLFVSVNTIKTHLKNIFIKLDITSRSEAIVLLNKAKTK